MHVLANLVRRATSVESSKGSATMGQAAANVYEQEYSGAADFAAIRMRIAQLPRVRIALTPTPLEEALISRARLVDCRSWSSETISRVRRSVATNSGIASSGSPMPSRNGPTG